MYEFENENCEILFAMKLQQVLKTKIVGKIFVRCVQDNSLYIQIKTIDNLEYRTCLNDFKERVLNGWTTEYAAYEVLADYKKFIIKQMMEKYFYY